MGRARSRIGRAAGLLGLFGALALFPACEPAADPGAAGAPPLRPAIPAFDGHAAHAWVKQQLSFGPRVPNTPGHERMAEWLEGFLRARAGRLEVHRFRHEASDGQELALANFWARFERPGSRPILVVAHWDTRPVSDRASDPEARRQPVPGANDGASGTAILLELAELMKRHPPPRSVDLLLVDGEDYGDFRAGRDVLLGSRRFATHLPPGYLPRFGVVLDMVGDRDLTVHPEKNSWRVAPEVVRRVWDQAARLGYRPVFRQDPRYAIQDDHTALNEAGIPTALVIDIDYAYWHTPEDTLDKVSPESLAIVGTVMTHLIYDGG